MSIGQAGKPWLQPEITQLFELRDVETLEWSQIAQRLGRKPEACKVKYNIEKRRQAGTYQRPPATGFFLTKRAERIAVNVAKAQQAAAPAPRSLTAELFGDPLPGRSALDAKLRGLPS
jgi:hypothetical protein